MTPKYLVFLDVDGVFVTPRSNAVHELQHSHWTVFDPVAVHLMNWLHDTYPVRFVLMSTWKDGLDVNDKNLQAWVNASFRNSGFRGAFAENWKVREGGYPSFRLDGRALEVLQYLKDFGEFEVEDFLLFDDTPYQFNALLGKKRFVQTDANNGVLLKHVQHTKSLTGPWSKR